MFLEIAQSHVVIANFIYSPRMEFVITYGMHVFRGPLFQSRHTLVLNYNTASETVLIKS